MTELRKSEPKVVYVGGTVLVHQHGKRLTISLASGHLVKLYNNHFLNRLHETVRSRLFLSETMIQ